MSVPKKYEHVQCRAIGHAWMPHLDTDRPRSSMFTHVLSLVCATCGTERHDAIGATGRLVTRAYKYPEDYKVTDIVDRAEWRQSLVRRLARRAA